MPKHIILRLFYLIATVIAVSGCVNSGPPQTTEVDRVLKAASIENAPFSNIVVVGAAPSRETMRRIEVGFTQELAKRKIDAHSFVRNSPAKEPSEEAIMALVKETNADAILVVSGVIGGPSMARQTETVAADVQRQVRGQTLVNFFRYDYKDIQRTTWNDFTLNVQLVSDLYEVTSNQRVYSVESNTSHGKTGFDIIIAEAETVVARMHKDRVIR
jgi:hypothetical protein